MSALSIHGELQEIRWVAKPERPTKKKLESSINAFNYLARELPASWSDLPEELRRALVDVAYAIARPPEPPFIQGFLGRLYAIWMVLTGQTRDLLELYEASMEFADVVLSLHEREHEALQEELGKRVQELSEEEDTQLISYEDFVARVLES